ncbi:MAG: hypothetical protein BWY54_00251 [Candidatus Dependentiae bacterium ADurb.Bin331]|nr:MAG: hypothetical protein BWY54_00251 [Candidatus Dependentiae bacterium ADurb.Bin331]
MYSALYFFSLLFFSIPIDALPLINFSRLKNYNPVSLAFKQITDSCHYASAHKKLFSVLSVETLPLDEQLLYERFFHLLSKAHTERIDNEEIEKTSFMKLLAEKMTIFVDEEGNMQSEAVILSDIAYRLNKLTLLQDDEIKKIINQFEDEKNKFRRFIKVIKHIYEEIGLPEIGIDRKKAMSIFNETLKNSNVVNRANTIIGNPSLSKSQKEHELHELNNYLMMQAQQKSQVIDWRGWKSHIIKKTHYLQLVIDHKIYGKKINEIIQKDRKNRLREFEKENNEFRNKYILIERGDRALNQYNYIYTQKNAQLKNKENIAKNHEQAVQEQWKKIDILYDKLGLGDNFSDKEFKDKWRVFAVNNHPDKLNAIQNTDEQIKANHVAMQNANEAKPIVESIIQQFPNRRFTKESIHENWLKENSVNESYSNAQLREYSEKFTQFIEKLDMETQKNEVNNKWQEERKRINFLIKNNRRFFTYDLPPLKSDLVLKDMPELKMPEDQLRQMQYQESWRLWNQYVSNQKQKSRKTRKPISELFEITQNPNDQFDEN